MNTKAISIQDIIDYALQRYPGVTHNHNWGEQGLFYNPDMQLPKGVYILTFKEKDGPNDSASCIDPNSAYRLNLGIAKRRFLERFGETPARPAAGTIVNTGHDFTKHNHITPHPVYGWMNWIAVINPSTDTFEELKPLLDESVQAAAKKFHQKVRKNQKNRA